MATERKIVTLEAELKQAKKDYGDLTQAEAWKTVNQAAHSIEIAVVELSYSSKPRAMALVKIASKMRHDLENAIGPQPGYSSRTKVEVPSNVKKRK